MENTENTNLPLIYQKISAIMAEVPAIGKTKRNAQQGFNYRGIDDVQNALQNLLPKHGVFYVPEVLDSIREERQTKTGGNLIYSVLKMKYTFYASDGSSVSAVVIGEGMDSGDKASNKAMAVAMKYAMFQVFCIPTEELDDPDAVCPPPSLPAPPPTVKCEKCGNALKGIRRKDGTIVTVPELAAISRERYQGRVLCRACMAEEKEGEQQNA